MSVQDVLEVVQLLERQGIRVWLDGGWGVDALLGEQRRPHKDLDVVLSLDHVDAAQQLLGARGFVLVRGGAPTAFVLEDSQRRSIDVHPVRFDEQRDGIYRMENGEDWVYPSAGFSGEGMVGGHTVRCLSAEVQMLCHTGYAFGEKDVQEVLALHERFGVAIPDVYRTRLADGPE